MVDLVVNEPYLQRVPVSIDFTQGIQAYGEDNLYPQRAELARDRSYTTKTSVKRYAGFILGQGFLDQTLANTIINRKGQTANDMLSFISKDYGTFTSFALHFNYNLNYRISEINLVKFKFVRFGTPTNKYGAVNEIKVNNNWERNPYKSYMRSYSYDDIDSYPIFNPDPKVVKDQMAQFGGIRYYPGQVLVFTPEMWAYPTATFDAVFDYAQVQYELGVFDISKLQNGLTATTVFKYPGEFKDTTEEEMFYNKLRAHKGSKGANSTLVVQNPTGANLNLTENLQLQNMDKLHTDLNKTAKNSIRESFSQPAEIHGQLPETGMFNKAGIIEAYDYYNSLTQEDRDTISIQMKKIFTAWHKPSFTNYDIKQKQYGQQVVNNPGQPEGDKADGGI